MRHIYTAGLLIVLALLSACQPQGVIPSQQRVGKPYEIDGKEYYPQVDESYDRTGEASWYGPGFHGKYTADHEVFDENDLTAAHPTLPMPSIVRVTNLENGKSLLVRINDRGPFKSNRIIDLSKAAAHELGIRSLARVRVQYLPQESEEFLASVKNGKPLTMAEVNEGAASAPQIVETSVTSSHTGQPVMDAAPVESVASNDLIPPAAAEPTTTTITNTEVAPPPEATTNADTGAEIAEEPVVQADLIAPMKQPKPSNLNRPTQPVRLIQQQPAGGSPPQRMASNEIQQEIHNEAQDDAQSDDQPAPPPQHVLKAPVHTKAAASDGSYIILAGAFSSKANADKLINKLSSVSQASVAQVAVNGKNLWRVHFGPFSDRQSADDALAQVQANGAPDARVTHQ